MGNVHNCNPNAVLLLFFCKRFVNNKVFVVVIRDERYPFVPEVSFGEGNAFCDIDSEAFKDRSNGRQSEEGIDAEELR